MTLVQKITLASATAAIALTTGFFACFNKVTVQPPPGEPLVVERASFPHQTFDMVLAKYVNGEGLVDYKGLKTDRADLERYIGALQKTSPH